MPETIEAVYRPLLEAVSFAARAHQGQWRKDQRTPYVSHVFRASLVLRAVFGIDDPPALIAALLHDTLEDTSTDFDDLRETFGPDVAQWVAALSKDKRRPETDREEAYARQLANSCWQVKVCKLADIFDNLMDSVTVPPAKRVRLFQRARYYLETLKPNLPEQARRPWQIVAELLSAMQSVP